MSSVNTPSVSHHGSPNPNDCPLYDPRLETMPDFANEWQIVIDAMVQSGSTQEDALASIQSTWQVRHNRRVAAWDAHKETERIRAVEEDQRRREDEEERARLVLQQKQTELAEAEKKKPKLGDFDENRAPPSSVPLRASNYALTKVRNKEYIELYHWTKRAMEKDAISNPTLSTSNTFTLANGDDGNLTLLPTLAHQNSQHVLADNKLTWDQFTDAIPGFLADIEAAKWPETHVSALHSFFYAITNHPSRLEPNGHEILVQFAAEQQKEWHMQLKASVETNQPAWNIAIINPQALSNVRDCFNNRLIDSMRSQVSPNVL
ncbi:hypothetical protein AAF712_016700 [Marasmius tenuissimus]|uniref:Uncharacterized protein n=1 Tax=Marasmius tenuissimus TaxID=585030 RepID=A0ABR2Z6U1_9AGAR